MTNELPQTQALQEAKPESISDLFSRDPEGFKREDDLRIVEAFRAQRLRWEAAERLDAAGGKGKKEKTKAEPGSKDLMKRKAGEPVVTTSSLDDLGL